VTVNPFTRSIATSCDLGQGSDTHETAEFSTSKSLAISVMVSDTVKKSNASQVHAISPQLKRS
jgi:hypothetical protein